MEAELKKVECFNRKEIPRDDEDISGDIKIDVLAPWIEKMFVYFRNEKECPFGRANWIIDMHFPDGGVMSLKLPKEMEKERVLQFIKPLTDALEKYKNSKLN